MSKTKITIHRGLAELKLIDSRISKLTSELQPVGLYQKDKLVNNVFTQDEFTKRSTGKLQSILDLINRKRDIKSAIVSANAVTMVTVAGKRMTIAEAITYKTIIQHKRDLSRALHATRNSAVALMNKKNDKVNESALNLAKAALGKDNVAVNDTDALAVTTPFLEKNTVHIIDPIKSIDVCEALDSEVDEFETDVDAVLSEVNATTFIKV